MLPDMTAKSSATGKPARTPAQQRTYTRAPRKDPAAEQAHEQEHYLAGLRKFGTLIHACQLAHVSPHKIYGWREFDADFVLREHEAQEHLTQDLEREALRRAFEGFDRPVYQKGELVGFEKIYSDSLMAMLLKARRPSVYRENINLTGTVESVVREVAGFDPTEVL
jgi:hypothetical protein